MDSNELVFSLEPDFMENISKILKKARRNANTAVNLSMVYAYYEIERKNRTEKTVLLTASRSQCP